MSFSRTSKTGATLSLLVSALRKTTLVRCYFGECVVKNIDLWFASTRRLALRITRMEDIIFVTGSHLAGSFANIAFSEGRWKGQVSFGAQVSGISYVKWQYPLDIQGVVLAVDPSGRVLPRFQSHLEGSWSNTIESSSTQGSAHIHQRVSCDTGSGNTTKASRRRKPNSESR